MSLKTERSSSLGMALVVSSSTPLILLDDRLVVRAVSGSFCRSFSVDPGSAVGTELFDLGGGEWNIPQLRSLLRATASGSAAIDAYEVDLKPAGEPPRSLILNAHVLDHDAEEPVRVVLAVNDVTLVRQTQREKDALIRDKYVLLQELNHRIANSLQIIASVLMQRVRKVQSDETRTHLREAHQRVMAIATLQRQLASAVTGDVALRPYFLELCASISASMVANPVNLTLSVDIDDSVTTADRSVSLGLIVTELVINALKHAYPDPDTRGHIRVGFHTRGEEWTLTVADDGVGFPAERDEHKSGLGTSIVNALAEQLSAFVEVTDAKPGVLVSIVHDDPWRGSTQQQA